MTGKCAANPGVLPPSLAGCRKNSHVAGVLGGSGRNRCHQVAEAHQVICHGGEGEHPPHPLHASVSGFPKIAHGFHPTEDFLYPFAQALTDSVAPVTGGAAVNGRGTPCAVLGRMGHGPEGAQRVDKLPGVISLVPPTVMRCLPEGLPPFPRRCPVRRCRWLPSDGAL
jgi:hypothetical protein